MEANASSLLGALREHTRQKHERLDRLLGERVFVSQHSYAQFLLASWRAASPIESAIASRLGADFAPERAPRLRADLRALQIDLTSEAVPAIELESDAAAWGAAYVLEGSALGGVVLAESAQRALVPEVARSYLTLRAAETAARWRWFLGALAEFSARATTLDRAQAATAAGAAFDSYTLAFLQVFPEA